MSNDNKAGSAAQAVEPKRRDIFAICDAYESGIGHGLQRDGHKSGAIFGNPECGMAYEIGYEEGEERSSGKKPAAPPVAAEQPAAERDWKKIAYELAQRVNMAITYGNFGTSGMMLDTETHTTRSVKDWMADAMEMMPGVTVRRDLMHMTAAQRRKAMKAGAQSVTAHGEGK